jgi:GTP cyclohydrolase I
MRKLTHEQVNTAASYLADKIVATVKEDIRIYPIPRGGVPVAYLILPHLIYDLKTSDNPLPVRIVDTPESANVFVDDIIDSGKTFTRWTRRYPGIPFFALYNKIENPEVDWIVFPWEGDSDGSINDAVVRLLQFIGEDPNRGGLLETPARVAKAWKEMTTGYGQDPHSILKCFEDGGESYDEMILERGILFYSNCEHHMLPFFGTADIAYLPNGKVLGLSKIPRLLEIFARRLQGQERLTVQVADSLFEGLGAKGVGVRISARHLCMECRGVNKQETVTVTTALRGVFLKPEVRAEFLSSVR